MARGSVDRWRRWLIDNSRDLQLNPAQIDALATRLHALRLGAPRFDVVEETTRP
jgi:hypothetical protein